MNSSNAYWSNFCWGDNFVVCGPAGCAIYSCKDTRKPRTVITKFGGIACAACYGRALAFVGRPFIRAGEQQYPLTLTKVTRDDPYITKDDPALGVWRAAAVTDKSVVDAEEEDEDMVRNHGIRSVRLINFESGDVVAELIMKSAVCGIGMNETHLVVVLEDCTYVYRTVDLAKTAKDLGYKRGEDDFYGPIVNCDGPVKCKPVIVIQTPLNMNGVFALSSGCDGTHSIVALPGKEVGSVMLYDLTEENNTCLKNLHSHAIAALAISYNGRILATCSEEGKIINLIAIDGRSLRTLDFQEMCIFKLRRGNTASVPTSLAFSRDATLFASASVSGSAHVFDNSKFDETLNKKIEDVEKKKLMKSPAPESSVQSSIVDWITPSAETTGWVGSIFVKSFEATANGLSKNTRIVCGLSKDEKGVPFLVVIQSSGLLSTYLYKLVEPSGLYSFISSQPYHTLSLSCSSQVVQMRIDDDSAAVRSPAPPPAAVAAADSARRE